MFAVWGSQSSGKTTLAVNLAVLLSTAGFMTCLVSANDHGEFQSFLGVGIPKGKGMYAALSSGRNVRESLTEAKHNLCILEAATGGDAYDLTNIMEDQAHGIIEDLRDQFTFVIVDCTPSKESVFTGIGIVEADKVIVCIPHRASAATWHISNKQMLEAIANKTVYVDCNTREGGCNMDQLLASIDLPECEVRIPCVDSAYLCENRSRPIVQQSGRAEKKYKNQLLKLMNIILGIQAKEAATAKKNREKVKRGEAVDVDRRGLDVDDPRRIHTTTGLSSVQKKGGRSTDRDDEEAMRRLRERRGNSPR